VVTGGGVGNTNTTRRDPSGFEYMQNAADKANFEAKCAALCRSLEVYLQTHTYFDIQKKAESQGVNLIGFNQPMCSYMKKGKACVKNPQTVEWLTNFLNNKI
jgi:hypothetical protein